MFSATVEYALRAAVFLATKSGQPATTEEVARRTQVPVAYLAKILQVLSKAGLVRSQRGVGGGVTLAVHPDDLTLLEVLNAVEPVKRIKICPLGLPSHGPDLCPLHLKIDSIYSAIEVALGGTTLSDLLDDNENPSLPLCEVDELEHF